MLFPLKGQLGGCNLAAVADAVGCKLDRLGRAMSILASPTRRLLLKVLKICIQTKLLKMTVAKNMERELQDIDLYEWAWSYRGS